MQITIESDRRLPVTYAVDCWTDAVTWFGKEWPKARITAINGMPVDEWINVQLDEWED